MTKTPVIQIQDCPPIIAFDGEFRWLSNFWPAAVWLDGIQYPSVEHAFQAAKFRPEDRRPFRTGPAGSTKKLGRGLPAQSDWLDRRFSVMEALLQQKFAASSDLGNLLLSTGDRPLIEGNTWGDRFWGVCNGEGENQLGHLLMAQRDRIKARTVMGCIRVGSKRTGGTRPKPDETQIHGDRQSSVFGNPFPLTDWKDPVAREQVIERFFLKCFSPDVLSKGPIYAAMQQLATRINEGEKLILMCWCAPLKCHCQHIAKGVELLASGKDIQQAIKRSLAHRKTNANVPLGHLGL